MSVTAMAFVFKLKDIDPTDKFVLIAYADHADNDGGSIFPAVQSIADKTGYTTRTVQRATHNLESMGLLVLDGVGPHGTHRWAIDLNWKPPSKGSTKVTPVPKSSPPCTKVTPTPVPKSPDPSLNHQQPSLAGKERPPEKKPAKPPTLEETKLKTLVDHFSVKTGIPVPKLVSKSDYSSFATRWKKPLQAILEHTHWDIAAAADIVDTAVDEILHTTRLDISYPKSIEWKVNGLYARNNVHPDNNGYTRA